VTRFLWSWRLARLPLTRLTFCFRFISVNPRLVICDDAFHEVLILFCLLKEISGDRQAGYLLFDGEDTRREICSNASRVQFSVKMASHVP
jgi:hypothetical protein